MFLLISCVFVSSAIFANRQYLSTYRNNSQLNELATNEQGKPEIVGM